MPEVLKTARARRANLETLRVELEAQETSERFKVGERKQSETLFKRPSPGQTSGSALVSKDGEEFKIRCAYCNAPHYSASCDSVTDPTK